MRFFSCSPGFPVESASTIPQGKFSKTFRNNAHVPAKNNYWFDPCRAVWRMKPCRGRKNLRLHAGSKPTAGFPAVFYFRYRHYFLIAFMRFPALFAYNSTEKSRIPQGHAHSQYTHIYCIYDSGFPEVSSLREGELAGYRNFRPPRCIHC